MLKNSLQKSILMDRTATDTIKGYFYQFDYAIVKLLELTKGTEKIIVEGIEDVDVNTATDQTAIQCKYYAKTEYNHSVIARPIRLMLDHYKLVTTGKRKKIKYKLYGYFESGQNKLALPINIDFLKNHFLTYSIKKVKYYHHTKLGLSDSDLKNFLSLLTIDINAIEYEKQLKNISSSLVNHFKCSAFEAENFYYNNAIKVIKDISVQSVVAKRTISKNDFINKINFKRLLFNEWFIIYKGESKLFANLKSEYFTNFNISPFERFFIIDVPNFNYLRSELKTLIFTISRKWSKLSKREPNPFCPYVYLNNIPEKELIELKKELSLEGFKFIDGFDYMGAEFDPDSISKPATFGNLIKLKLINKVDHIDLVLAKITKTKEIYQFYIDTPFYNCTNPGIKAVTIQIKKINDIQKII